MARILVMHYTDEGKIPSLSTEDLVKIKENAEKALKEKYPNVKFHGTYIDEEGRGICDFEAPNVEAVKDIVDNYTKAPYDAIIKVEPALF